MGLTLTLDDFNRSGAGGVASPSASVPPGSSAPLSPQTEQHALAAVNQHLAQASQTLQLLNAIMNDPQVKPYVDNIKYQVKKKWGISMEETTEQPRETVVMHGKTQEVPAIVAQKTQLDPEDIKRELRKFHDADNFLTFFEGVIRMLPGDIKLAAVKDLIVSEFSSVGQYDAQTLLTLIEKNREQFKDQLAKKGLFGRK